MKNYILFNITLDKDSVLESILDDNLLKEIPFGSKFKTPNLAYNNILIEWIGVDASDSDFSLDFDIINSAILHLNNNSIALNPSVVYSIYKLFKPYLSKLVKAHMSIDILGTLGEDEFDVLYTDGSFSKNLGAASYACCKLLNEDATNGTLDLFTNKKWAYQPFSGMIPVGTNNVGELTALRVACNNLSNKKVQIIISDSIYGLKSYREYIYVWRKNGYKTYSNKEIKNKQLIIDTANEISEATKDKILLFKWTKGHNNDNFNEICDELAKKELDI